MVAAVYFLTIDSVVLKELLFMTYFFKIKDFKS